MQVTFLIPEPDVYRAGADKQNFILGEMLVLRDAVLRRQILQAGDEVLRAVVFGAGLQYELRGRRRQLFCRPRPLGYRESAFRLHSFRAVKAYSMMWRWPSSQEQHVVVWLR